jgi:hypothetical protein
MSRCRVPSGAHDQILLCHRSDCYGPLSRGAPHLTRGRVSHLSEVCLNPLYNYTYSSTISYIPYRIFTMYTIYMASVSPGFVKQIKPYLTYSML